VRRPSATRVAARYAATFQVEIGQPIWYGKYKNKRGIIVGFETNEKGDVEIEVDPVPKGKKKSTKMKLFKIRPREEG